MRPRLTIIGINYAPESSGIAPYAAALAQGMTTLGWQVKVITGYPSYPQWQVYDGYEGRRLEEDHDGDHPGPVSLDDPVQPIKHPHPPGTAASHPPAACRPDTCRIQTPRRGDAYGPRGNTYA